jgi:hypothetical protein
MPVTSNTGTVTPVLGGEITIATIGGGPFDVVSAFAIGGGTPDGFGQLIYRLYSIVGGLSSLVAESTIVGGGASSILQWQIPGSGGAASQFVRAGGTSYTLTVTAVPGVGQTLEFATQPRSPATATVAGDDENDAAAPATISPVLVVPPYSIASSPNVAGFAQSMDVSVDQTGLPQTTIITIFANNGPGSVEAVVQSVTLPGPDATTAVLRNVTLPAASVYRVGVSNQSGAAISVPLGIATYSVVAVAGAGALTPLAGNVGVSGPENANLIAPTAPLQGEALVTQFGAAAWQSAVQNNPYWNQATWFVDPLNSTGTASDANDGMTVATAVLSYNGGIATKWGTYSPRLRQNTSIQWLSSQLGTGDPVILTPIMDALPPSTAGAVLMVSGVLGPSQEVGSGVLAGVIAKNRTTGQLLTADLGVVFPQGTLIQNTTPGKASFAWTYLNTGGTTFNLTQPLAPIVPPADFGNVTEVDTWANGDTFVAYAPVAINVIKVQPLIAVAAPIPTPTQSLQLINMYCFSVNGAGGSSIFIYNNVTLTQCVLDSYLIDNTENDVRRTGYINVCAIGGGASGNASNIFSMFLAGLNLTPDTASYAFDYDAILDAGFGSLMRSPFSDPIVTKNQQGRLYISGKSIWNGTWDLTNGNLSQPPACVIWGPGLFEAQGAGTRIFIPDAPGSAETVFLNTGGIHLDDQTVANTFDPITNVWSGPFTITAANIDNPAEFNGFAINVGGACITNQGTP